MEEKEESPRIKKRSSKIQFDMRTDTHKVVYEDEEPPKRMKPPPANAARSDVGGGKHPGEASSSEGPEKSWRASEGLSSSLTFVGNIGPVRSYAGIEMWVDDEEPFETNYAKDIEDSICFDYVDDFEQGEFPPEADGPPDLSSDELLMLDNEAGVEEIKRLFELHVLEGCDVAVGDDVLLDTRCVFDWRYRDEWRRRYGLVAREFNVTGETTSETFSPTMASMRMLLVLAIVERLYLVAL